MYSTKDEVLPAEGILSEKPLPNATESEQGESAQSGFALPALSTLLGALLAGCPNNEPGPDPIPDSGRPPALPANLRRLVARTTYGVDGDEAQRALDLGYEGYLEYQLAYEAIDDSALNAKLAPLTTLRATPKERLESISREDFSSVEEFLTATLLRGAYSKRQLYERMVEFWSDHFNIYFPSDTQLVLKPLDDLEVVRPHALGRFPDLLSQSAKSPAMLIYLDNASSRLGAPNENYARELMELHTLGVDQFTQEDVKEVARAFTGWSVNGEFNDADFGRFRFYPPLHDRGEKTILGHRLAPNGGMSDGEQVLALLSTDPDIASSTAHFIGRKLAVRFWGDSPPDALVEEIAAAYLQTNGDIKAMLRVVLREDWLMQAPPKLKRPYHYALSSLRAIPSDIRDAPLFAALLQTMEHLPFHWAPPNGYPDTAGYWGNYLMPRWTYGLWLVYQQGAIDLALAPFLSAESDAVFLDEVDARLFHYGQPEGHRAALADYLAGAPDNFFRRLEALSMALSSADFQWH